MKKLNLRSCLALLAATFLIAVVALLILVGGGWGRAASTGLSEVDLRWSPPEPGTVASLADHGFLYGRIIIHDGTVYEGRFRWGGDEEAFWSDSFNGVKKENPWAAQARSSMPEERHSFEIFGKEISMGERSGEIKRPFAARFGDLLRIEAQGAETVRVTLKSETSFDLDRFEAGDFDDGVRVWDAVHGVTDLDSVWIRSVEFLPTPALGEIAERLHGTVRTRNGEEFTGFLQWDRKECVASDRFKGRSLEGAINLPFGELRSLTRRTKDDATAILRDGREIALAGIGRGHRGVSVDDSRYGRVLISWDVFDRIEFRPLDSGPGYDTFSPGRPLRGSVKTRDGHHFVGQLVYDLDESETTETLDASFQGVNYSISFGDIESIVTGLEPGSSSVVVTLQDGTALRLEPVGDLGPDNAGLLVITDDAQDPEYVPWNELEGIYIEAQ